MAAIVKAPGTSFGAKLTFYHVGEAAVVDVGWCAHMGETYVWALAKDVAVAEHGAKTKVEVTVGGKWPSKTGLNTYGMQGGQLIGAQAVVWPRGTIVGNTALNSAFLAASGIVGAAVGTTPKLGEDLKVGTVAPLLIARYSDAYKIDVGASAFSDLTATPNGAV